MSQAKVIVSSKGQSLSDMQHHQQVSRRRRRQEGGTILSSSNICRRTTSWRTTIATATTLAISAISYSSAFQSSIPSLAGITSMSPQQRCGSSYPYDNSRRWIMTDPETILGAGGMDDDGSSSNSRRRSTVERLNSAYLASPGHDVDSMLDDFFLNEVILNPDALLPTTSNEKTNRAVKKTVKTNAKLTKATTTSSTTRRKKRSPIAKKKKPVKALASLSKKEVTDLKNKRRGRSSLSKAKAATMAAAKEPEATTTAATTTRLRSTAKRTSSLVSKSKRKTPTTKSVTTKNTQLSNNVTKKSPKHKSTAASPSSRKYSNNVVVPHHMADFASNIQDNEELADDTMKLLFLYENMKEQLQRKPTDEEFCAAAGKINLEAIQQFLSMPGVKSSVQLKSTRNTNSDRTKAKASSSATVTIPSSSTSTPSRSSTMPGFINRQSKNERMYEDSLKLIESRNAMNGKDISKIISETKKNKSVQARQKFNGEKLYSQSNVVPDSLLQFSSEIHQLDRIAPKEEIVLGTKCQEAMKLQSLYDDLQLKLDRPPTNDEWCAAAGKINIESIKQIIDDGINAKNTLVTSNLRMVQSVVNVYIRNGLGGQYNAGDLMQEGTMALIRAAEKFEPERGLRFSTYAMYWIRAAVKRSQVLQSRVIPVPQRLHESHKRIIRVEQELKASLGRKPTKTELSSAVAMTEKQLDRCIKAMSQECFSLDNSVQNQKKPGDNRESSMYELVSGSNVGENSGSGSNGSRSSSSKGTNDVFDELFMKEDLIETLFRHLSEDQVYLLLLRFGLIDPRALPTGYNKGGPLTIAQISSLVGLKPDKVRRNIDKSLKHIKDSIENEWGGSANLCF